jgi:hypothetical protein
MGNCCLPEKYNEPLEFIAESGEKGGKGPREKGGVKWDRSLNNEGTSEQGSKKESKAEMEGLSRTCKRISSHSLLAQSLGLSGYSKLNYQEFHQFVQAPSSTRLTLLERLENEPFPPDEVFVKLRQS